MSYQTPKTGKRKQETGKKNPPASAAWSATAERVWVIVTFNCIVTVQDDGIQRAYRLQAVNPPIASGTPASLDELPDAP
jgi:hypothetical protein